MHIDVLIFRINTFFQFAIGIPFAIGLRPHPSIKDLGGLVAIEYGDHTSCCLLNSKQDDLTPYWSS